MCVDTYEYKHFSSIKTKMCKRLHFVNQDQIERIFLLNIAQFQQNGKIDISRILHHLTKKGLDIEGDKFYIESLDKVIDPKYSTLINYEKFQSKDQVIHILKSEEERQNIVPLKITAFAEEQSSRKSSISKNKQSCRSIQKSPRLNSNRLQSAKSLRSLKSINETSQTHRMKEPQRKIGQVLQQVKSWRLLHEINHLSLGDAAKMVGICKKSLDDYYLVLRIGQYSDFDFKNNLDKGMGQLRAFVKRQDFKKQGRLPILVNEFKMFELIRQQKLLEPMENEDIIQFNMKPSQIQEEAVQLNGIQNQDNDH